MARRWVSEWVSECNRPHCTASCPLKMEFKLICIWNFTANKCDKWMHSWRRRMAANVVGARCAHYIEMEKNPGRATHAHKIGWLECNKIPFYDRIAMSVFIFLINFRCCFVSIRFGVRCAHRQASPRNPCAVCTFSTTSSRIEIEIEHFIGYWNRQITPADTHACTPTTRCRWTKMIRK